MILLYWKDLILKSRIKQQAQNQGAELTFARNLEDLAEALKNCSPTRLIVDLTPGPVFASSFKEILKPSFESIGVVAHVDLPTQKAATEAGFTQVIPRSILVRDLENLLSAASLT